MKNKNSPSEEFSRVEKFVKSWELVQRNGWAIKISSLNEDNIMLLFASQYTGQTILRYCVGEQEAVATINVITHKNAREILDLGY